MLFSLKWYTLQRSYSRCVVEKQDSNIASIFPYLPIPMTTKCLLASDSYMYGNLQASSQPTAIKLPLPLISWNKQHQVWLVCNKQSTLCLIGWWLRHGWWYRHGWGRHARWRHARLIHRIVVMLLMMMIMEWMLMSLHWMWNSSRWPLIRWKWTL